MLEFPYNESKFQPEGKSHEERPDTFGLTCPLLMTKEGKKMGKTESGTLWVARDKTVPYTFYQYFYNTDDADTGKLLKAFTDIPTAEIDTMCKDDIVAAKRRMAYEVTKLVHGEEEANKAVEAAKALFSKGTDMSDVPTTKLEKAILESGIGILDLVVKVGFIPSKGEARCLIQQGGLSLNGKRISAPEQQITLADMEKDALLIQKGKKNFLRVIAM